MKFFIAIILASIFSIPCFAQQRLGMTEDSSENDATDLIEAAADSASSGDLDGFLDCFTKKCKFRIRRKMKQIFDGHEINMKIINLKVESNDGEKMQISIKYSCDDGVQRHVVTSMILARLEGESWKVASESVEKMEAFSVDHDDFLPKDMPRVAGGCAGGQCGLKPAAAPEANPQGAGNINIDDLLPKDMSRTKGGCPNGRCGI
jgi:hypothetical protein